jgi:hypothetical protein
MLRCTCCGRWTVEAVALDRGRGAGVQAFYRVRYEGHTWEEYLTLAAAETDLAERGILEYQEPDDQ